MSPRPIYRWKSFWLGLFVLISLGWGWLRSMGHAHGVEWSGSTWTFHLKASQGVMELTWFPDTTLGRGLVMEAQDDGFVGRLFPRPWLVLWDDFGLKVRLAYWFVLLGLGMLWAASLIWRRRRDEARAEKQRWREMGIGE